MQGQSHDSFTADDLQVIPYDLLVIQEPWQNHFSNRISCPKDLSIPPCVR